MSEQDVRKAVAAYAWPETCPGCGADLVEEYWMEAYERGPVLLVSVCAGGQPDLVHAKPETADVGVAVTCGNCGEDLWGNVR